LFPPESVTLMITNVTRLNILSFTTLQRALTNTGYDISVAFDEESAIALIQKLKTYLILLDVIMPGLDGFQVWKRLK
jgi:PleD family two-component response regulator